MEEWIQWLLCLGIEGSLSGIAKSVPNRAKSLLVCSKYKPSLLSQGCRLAFETLLISRAGTRAEGKWVALDKSYPIND